MTQEYLFEEEEEEEEIETAVDENGDPIELPPKLDDEEDGGEAGDQGEPGQPFKTFQTQEEYDAFIAEERAKLGTPAAPAPVVENKPAVPTRIFPEDYKPKDWNDFVETLLSKPEVVSRLKERLVPETAKALEELTQKEQADLLEINRGFDAEFDGLAKQGLVPDRNTPEGKKVNQQITELGASFGQTSINGAYKLWKKVPVAQGGGLDYVPPEKQKLNKQKQKSGLIGSSKGTHTGGNKKKLSYKELHKKNLDDILEDEIL